MVSELKELTSALTTPEMQKEIQELKKECAHYTERLGNIKAATNHVTPEEKEKVSWGAGGCLCGAGANTRRTDNHVSSLQVYKERQKYCKEWRKRKRMVSENPRVALEAWEVPITREVSVQNDPAGSALYYSCPSERGFVSCQTTELCDAILEGYPKSKKQFFVSDSFSCSPGIFAQRTPPFLSLPHRRKLG